MTRELSKGSLVDASTVLVLPGSPSHWPGQVPGSQAQQMTRGPAAMPGLPRPTLTNGGLVTSAAGAVHPLGMDPGTQEEWRQYLDQVVQPEASELSVRRAIAMKAVGSGVPREVVAVMAARAVELWRHRRSLGDDGRTTALVVASRVEDVEKARKADPRQMGLFGGGAPAKAKASGGPYIGPRGGKWADPEHTIAWDDKAGGAVSAHPVAAPTDAPVHKPAVGHRYGLRNRPPQYGAVPKGYVHHEPHEDFRHGVLTYDHELSAKDVESYELTPILTPGQLAGRVEAAVDHLLSEYPERVRELASKSPRHFEQMARLALERQEPGHLPDMPKLVETVRQAVLARGPVKGADLPKSVEVHVHPKITGRAEADPTTFHVVAEKDGHVQLSRHKEGGYGPWMPKESVRHFKNDLEGRVDVEGKSGNADVDQVIVGKATFLGKGDDGMAFKVGDKVVKVSTTVPYQPENPGHRSPKEAVQMLRGQVETGNKLAGMGIAGIQRSEFVEHGDKGFQIKPWVEIPEKFTRAQLDAIQDIVIAVHKAGYSIKNSIQAGLDADGKPVLFDVGKAGPTEGTGIFKSDDDDMRRLKELYQENGVPFARKDVDEGAKAWATATEIKDEVVADIRAGKGDPKSLGFIRMQFNIAAKKRRQVAEVLEGKAKKDALDAVDFDLEDLDAELEDLAKEREKMGKAFLVLEKADRLKGGRADGRKPSEFPKAALREGTLHELEHTDDPDVAREIAMDHLAEDADYYVKLRKMEAGEKVEKAVTHKYIEREGVSGHYRYLYAEGMKPAQHKLPAHAVSAFETDVRELAEDPESHGLDEDETADYQAMHAAVDYARGTFRLPDNPDAADQLARAVSDLSNAQDAVAEGDGHADPEERKHARHAAQALATLSSKLRHRAEELRERGVSLEKAQGAGPFIGPRGGKWADAAHTIPWQEAEHGSKRTGVVKVPNAQVREVGEAIMAGLKADRRGQIRAATGGHTQTQISLADGRVLPVHVYLHVDPNLKDPRGVSGLASVARKVVDGQPSIHSVDIHVRYRHSPGNDVDHVGAQIRSVLSHEMTHVADLSLHARQDKEARGMDGRGVRASEVKDQGYGVYVNDKSEVTARLQQIVRDIMDVKSVAEIRNAYETWKSDPEQMPPPYHPVDVARWSPTWEAVEEHLTPENRKRVLKVVAQVIDGIQTGRLEAIKKALEADGTFAKAGGPFIGPRGGKWADAAHTIPWEEPKAKTARKKSEPENAPLPGQRHLFGPAREVQRKHEQMALFVPEKKAEPKKPTGNEPLPGQMGLFVPKPQGSARLSPGELAKISEVGAPAMDQAYPVKFKMIDWGQGKARGQGKRMGGMVMGGMGDAPRGEQHYPDWGATYGLESTEAAEEVSSLKGLEVVRYRQARTYGLTHDQAMTYVYVEGNAAEASALLSKAVGGGPYIGPKGGKWADPELTVHWEDRNKAGVAGKAEPTEKPVAGKPEASTPGAAPKTPDPASLGDLKGKFGKLSEKEQQQRYFLDRNSGLLSERGAAIQPHDPSRPMTARFSLEGQKVLNDVHGHDVPDGAFRLMAQGLSEHIPDGVKRRGDLEGDVRDQAHADEIAATMSKRLDPTGKVKVIATAVPRQPDHNATLEALGTAHQKRKDTAAEAGAFAARGAVPAALAGHADPHSVLGPIAKRMQAAKVGVNAKLTEHHAAAFKAAGTDKAFHETHVEASGLMTEDGFTRSLEAHPGDHIASADLRGLKMINDAFGRDAADKILAEFSALMARKGGGELNAGHPHGDEYLAHHPDPAKLNEFFGNLKTASDNLVFFAETPGGVVIQQGLHFVHGVGKDLDEADRVDLARNKAAQGVPPGPQTHQRADANRILADLGRQGFSIIGVGGGAGSPVRQGVPGQAQGKAGAQQAQGKAGAGPQGQVEASPGVATPSAAPQKSPKAPTTVAGQAPGGKSQPSPAHRALGAVAAQAGWKKHPGGFTNGKQKVGVAQKDGKWYVGASEPGQPIHLVVDGKGAEHHPDEASAMRAAGRHIVSNRVKTDTPKKPGGKAEKLAASLTEGLAVADLLEKMSSHKYLRRVATGDPKRKWRYYYQEERAAAVGKEFKVGEKLRLTSGSQAGHYEVTAIHGDYATVRHDETQHEVSIHRDRLAQMFHDEHLAADVRRKGDTDETHQKRKEEAEAKAKIALQVSQEANRGGTVDHHKEAAKLHTEAADAGAVNAGLHRDLADAHTRAAVLGEIKAAHAEAEAQAKKVKVKEAKKEANKRYREKKAEAAKKEPRLVVKLQTRKSPMTMGKKAQSYVEVLAQAGFGDADEVRRDFQASDANYTRWLDGQRRGPRPPAYTGGELDAINEALGLHKPTGWGGAGKRDPRVSSLREGWDRLVGVATRWDDPKVKRAIEAFRQVPGLERVSVPAHVFDAEARGSKTSAMSAEQEEYYREKFLEDHMGEDATFDPGELGVTTPIDTSFDFGWAVGEEAAKSQANAQADGAGKAGKAGSLELGSGASAVRSGRVRVYSIAEARAMLGIEPLLTLAKAM